MRVQRGHIWSVATNAPEQIDTTRAPAWWAGAIIGALYTGAGIGSLLGPWLGGLSVEWTGAYQAASLAGVAVAAAATVATLHSGMAAKE